MSKEITHKISLPDRIENPSSHKKTIEINGKKHSFWNGEPEFLSIKDKNEKILKKGFFKIESIAYSDEQLKNINIFFLKNYNRLSKLRLFENFEYNQWKVYKRHDDILFYIYEVWGADMKIDVNMYLFPFLGGVVDVTEQIQFHPEDFGFEYKFHLFNEAADEKN